MDGGAGYPFSSGRTSTKRSFSQMADSHRTDEPYALFPTSHPRTQDDDHYNNNEHRPQRRRIESLRPGQPAVHHFPGDGLDFHWPVMSTNGLDVRAAEEERTADQHLETIDLTDDASAERVHNMSNQAQRAPETASAAAAASSSHAQRLPRYDRDIIDLGSSDEEYERPPPPPRTQSLRLPGAGPSRQQLIPALLPFPSRPTESGLRRPGFMRQPSPAVELDDVEVVGSRPRSRVQSRRATPMPFTERSATPRLANNTIDLTVDDDDDVVLTDIRNNGSGINGDLPAMAGSGIGTRDEPDYGGMGIGRLANRMMARGREFPGNLLGGAFPNHWVGGELNADQRAAQSRVQIARRRRQELEARMSASRQREAVNPSDDMVGGLFGEARRILGPAIGAPLMMMDYDVVGFDMGLAGPARPATPKYEPPPTTGTGFTRSPGEDEIVVCPNCGDELAVGEGEEKQQVWVIKHCGHAYCGECAASRTRTISKKGKGRASDAPPPFKKCVVKDCGKSAAKSAFVHVFMSS